MKKRWMRSVIEASKTEATVLPFQRGRRIARRRAAPMLRARKIA